MTLIEVITTEGRMQILKNSFPNDANPIQFGYAGCGISDTVPTVDSTRLGLECDPSTHGTYSRVPITATYDEENERVVLEAIFSQTNITNSAVIKEVAIFTTDILGEGIPLAICQIAPFTKNSSVQLKIDIIISLTSE